MSFTNPPSADDGISLETSDPTGAANDAPMDLTKYKTKLCRNFAQKGICSFGGTCMFAHGSHDMQASTIGNFQPRFVGSNPTKYKTKLCRHFANTGACPFMDRCGFAHGQMELAPMPAGGMPPPMMGPMSPGMGPMSPPGMPPMSMGGFPPGFDGYYYPPGMAQPMKRAPVMELAKTRLCKHFSATGSCPYEARCLFAHGETDLRPRDPATPSGVAPAADGAPAGAAGTPPSGALSGAPAGGMPPAGMRPHGQQRGPQGAWGGPVNGWAPQPFS
jgi:hypothetical protein